MEQTIRTIGNSAGIVIPSGLLKKLNLSKGSKVIFEEFSDGKSFIVSKKGALSTKSSISPEFIKILEGVNSRYGQALKKLAQQQ